MRISDWSSDVCSSDLAIHGDPDQTEEDGPAAHRRGRRRRDGDLDVGGRGRGRGNRQCLYQRRRDLAGTEGRRLCDKSEEHTSELQSLMRISYAVFCLKQKTTTHEQIKYTHNKTKNNYK